VTVIVMIERARCAAQVSEELRRRGIEAVQVQFPRQTVFVVAKANSRAEDREAIERLEGVERVIDVQEPYRLVHRAFRPEGTRVELGPGAAVGRGRFAVMADLAGEVESEDLLRMARGLQRDGATALIVTLPQSDGSSGGPKRSAVIAALAETRDATGLPVGVEVTSDRDLSDCSRTADLYRLGPERMQDYRFLRRVGEAGKPVVLVRALSATLEEWLLAAEYLAAAGNDQVVLCERGIRSFAPETGRVTLDLASVARLNEMTHLPVIVDPLRACGSVSLGARLARAAIAAGADGIVFPLAAEAATAAAVGADGVADLLASLGPMVLAEGKELKRSSPLAALV
jgi:3-deoxy-7-phosphoheptulonate synthase